MIATRIAAALLLALGLAAERGDAQNYTGRWIYEEAGRQAILDIRHDQASGRVSGSLDVDGSARTLEGRVTRGVISIEKMDANAIAAGGITITPDGDRVLVMEIARQGGDPVVWRMTRVGAAPSPSPADRAGAPPAPGGGTAAPSGFRSASANEFAGEWQALSDNESSGEFVELAVSGNSVQGVLTTASRGEFSGRVTVSSRIALEGSYRNGGFDVTLTNAERPGEPARATLRMRGEFLVFLFGGVEMGGYSRPGRPLVASAEGSADALALARAIRGRIYSSTEQASGRGGGFAGARVRVAFCADGTMALDASNVGTVPGGFGDGSSLGETITRRGTWTIVLLAGAPAIRANWRGTGATYSLTDYIRVRPSSDGSSAIIDGAEIPATGQC